MQMNNEAILNKLIELGYFPQHHTEWEFHINSADDYLVLQRALFDECGKRGIQIKIEDSAMELWWRNSSLSYTKLTSQPDTSRESFVKAFCKVVGVSCE